MVLQVAANKGVQLRPNCLHDMVDHPLLSAKNAQIAAGRQPRGAKVPHLVPDFQQTAVFCAKQPADILCGLMGKLATSIQLRTEQQQAVLVPKQSRFLRGCFAADSDMGVAGESVRVDSDECWAFKAVFGLPWDCEQFLRKQWRWATLQSTVSWSPRICN